MYELAFVGDLPLPNNTPSPSNKRERDEDEDEERTSGESSGYSPEPYPLPDGPQDVSSFDWPAEQPAPVQNFGLGVPLGSLHLQAVPLPMNSAELGRGNPTGMPTATEARYYYDGSDLFAAGSSQQIPDGMWTNDDRTMAMWNSVPNTFEYVSRFSFAVTRLKPNFQDG